MKGFMISRAKFTYWKRLHWQQYLCNQHGVFCLFNCYCLTILIRNSVDYRFLYKVMASSWDNHWPVDVLWQLQLSTDDFPFEFLEHLSQLIQLINHNMKPHWHFTNSLSPELYAKHWRNKNKFFSYNFVLHHYSSAVHVMFQQKKKHFFFIRKPEENSKPHKQQIHATNINSKTAETFAFCFSLKFLNAQVAYWRNEYIRW